MARFMKNTDFVIEKGIPIPPQRYRADKPRWPFLSLQPGQSLYAEDTKAHKSNLYKAANHFNRRHSETAGFKLVQRVVREDGKPVGVRVWRVEKE
jgi:hypothetical protein